MYEIGDDLPALGTDPERLALVQNPRLNRDGQLGRASKPLDLMSYSPEDYQPSIFWVEEDRRQGMLTFLIGLTSVIRTPSSSPALAYRLRIGTGNLRCCSMAKSWHSESGLCRCGLASTFGSRTQDRKNGVPAQPPVIKVEHLPSAKTGVAATFRARPATFNDAVVTYRLEFGDGVTLEGPEVSHAYTKAGTYQVVVTAVGLGGLTTEENFASRLSGSVSTRFVPAEKRRYQAPN